ncbi:MAG: HD domain-containing protein [Ardenticatenales bacterium]
MADAKPPDIADLDLGARVEAQLRFLVAIDALKHVQRRNLTIDGSRLENSAEHSWHLGLFARVLAEHSLAPVDVDRTVTMVLVHDIVEIDAGDTIVYDTEARAAKLIEERAAADRLFALLPLDQATVLRQVWDEFCAGESPEAELANAVDRLQPLLQNFLTGGQRWRDHGISAERILAVNAPVTDAIPEFGVILRRIVALASKQGWLPEDDGDGAP